MKTRMEAQTTTGGAAESAVQGFPGDGFGEQYSLVKILFIWTSVTLPMGLLAWVVGPTIIPYTSLHPGIVHWLLMIAGMMWQFVVALFVLKRELGTLRWKALRTRLWLNLPRDPETGRGRAGLLWWVVPCLMFSFVFGVALASYVDAPVTALFPALEMPARMDVGGLADPRFVGQWWLLGVVLMSMAFNYFLGEELLFRGVLLPKMRGVFGRWDWVANAVLFGLYHVHKPWALPSIILSNLAIAWPARRFRSNWMAVIVHGAEGLILPPIMLMVILGMVG